MSLLLENDDVTSSDSGSHTEQTSHVSAGQLVESTLFVRRESEGQRSEGSTPSFMGQALGMRPPKRTLSELGMFCFILWQLVCTLLQLPSLASQ